LEANALTRLVYNVLRYFMSEIDRTCPAYNVVLKENDVTWKEGPNRPRLKCVKVFYSRKSHDTLRLHWFKVFLS